MTINLNITINLEQKELLMKVSELAAALATLNTKVGTIATDVATLKANSNPDPDISAEAATNLVTLQTGIQAVADLAAPAPPTV